MKCADEDFEEATVPSDDAASAVTFVAAVAAAVSFGVLACLAECEDDEVRAELTSSVVAVADAAEAEGFAVADRAASDSPADAAAPLLARPLERRPAPSLRSEAVLGRVSLEA